MEGEEFKMEEMGISVDCFFGNEPKIKAKHFNRKIKLFREFALASLGALVKSKKGGKSSYITACDAFTASGIAGLQWKKHFKAQVHVSMADHDDHAKLKSNIEENLFDATDMTLNSIRVPGDPFQNQDENEVHVYQADARALLSMEAFQFIYLSPYKNCAEYIESAFHSVSHGGVVCFMVSDLTSFGRAPHVIRRQYAARAIKTEYWKEMSARIVLASMAVAAARCNKGIIPQYAVSLEDYLLVCVKVGRGHVRSEAALNEVVTLIHCRFCEERVFMEIQLAPEENPYSKLPCKCKQSHPGKTAVLIGPMWKGAIFNHEFLRDLKQCGQDLKLSSNFDDVAALLISESFGPDVKKETPGSAGKKSSVEGNGDPEVNTNNGQQLFNSSEQSQADEHSTDNLLDTDQEGVKRKPTEDSCDVDVKKMKKETELGKDKKNLLLCQSSNVPFYYNVNKVNKTINLPKLDKVVTMLKSSGYHASRTHFDPCAIRTSANVEQLRKVLS